MQLPSKVAKLQVITYSMKKLLKKDGITQQFHATTLRSIPAPDIAPC